ncbi:hypothetical protein BDAP_000848 [Binucleata daphniae]
MFFSSFYAAIILLKTLQSSSNPEIITNQIDPFEYEIPDATQFSIFESGITINQLSLFYANNPYVIFNAWIDLHPIINIKFIDEAIKYIADNTPNKTTMQENENDTKENYRKQIELEKTAYKTNQRKNKFDKRIKVYTMLHNFCNVKDEYFDDFIYFSFRTHTKSTLQPFLYDQDTNPLYDTLKVLHETINSEKEKILNELNTLFDINNKYYIYHANKITCCLNLFEILCRISLYRCTINDNEIEVSDEVKICIRAFLCLFCLDRRSFEIEKLFAVNTGDMCTITLKLKK